MQIDQPAAATLRFAKIVKSHPAHHAYDVVFLDDGSIAAGVQKLETHASNNAGTVDMMQVDQDPMDEWSPELQSPKDQKNRDIIAVVAMVGVTPVVIGTLPMAVSQMNFPDTFYDLHIERHASDLVETKDHKANWCVVHPTGAKIVMSKDGQEPYLTKMDYDKIFSITKNLDSWVDILLFTKKEAGTGISPKTYIASIRLLPEGFINAFAYHTINLTAGKEDIIAKAGRNIGATADENVSVHADIDVTINADDDMALNAGDTMTGNAGASIALTAPIINLN